MNASAEELASEKKQEKKTNKQKKPTQNIFIETQTLFISLGHLCIFSPGKMSQHTILALLKLALDTRLALNSHSSTFLCWNVWAPHMASLRP